MVFISRHFHQVTASISSCGRWYYLVARPELLGWNRIHYILLSAIIIPKLQVVFHWINFISPDFRSCRNICQSVWSNEVTGKILPLIPLIILTNQKVIYLPHRSFIISPRSYALLHHSPDKQWNNSEFYFNCTLYQYWEPHTLQSIKDNQAPGFEKWF